LIITIDEKGRVDPPSAAKILIRGADERRRTYQCSYCNKVLNHDMGTVTVHDCPQADM